MTGDLWSLVYVVAGAALTWLLQKWKVMPAPTPVQPVTPSPLPPSPGPGVTPPPAPDVDGLLGVLRALLTGPLGAAVLPIVRLFVEGLLKRIVPETDDTPVARPVNPQPPGV